MNERRYVIDIDADASDTDAITQLRDIANDAGVSFTNIALYTRDDVNADRPRFSSADTLVAFDATPDDVRSYVEYLDADDDIIVPIEHAYEFFA